MWIVFEMEGKGLIDELAKVVGPFETEEAADNYCAIHNFDGVMKVEEPE